MELCHHHGGGRLLVDLLDAHAHEEPKIEFYHHLEEVCCWSTCQMPVPMESPRWSFAIIMEEVGCWSTY